MPVILVTQEAEVRKIEVQVEFDKCMWSPLAVSTQSVTVNPHPYPHPLATGDLVSARHFAFSMVSYKGIYQTARGLLCPALLGAHPFSLPTSILLSTPLFASPVVC
jgi:hypothetical protein